MPLSTTCDGLLQPSLLTASISPMVPPLPNPHHLAEADQGSPATPDHEGVPKYSPKPLSAGPPEEVCDREQSPQCPLDGSAQMLNTEISSNLASPPAIPLFIVCSARGCPRFSSMQPPHGAAQESGFTPLCLLATHNTTGFVLNFSLELVFHITRRLGIGKHYRRVGVLKRPGGGKPPFQNPALQSNAGSS